MPCKLQTANLRGCEFSYKARRKQIKSLLFNCLQGDKESPLMQITRRFVPYSINHNKILFENGTVISWKDGLNAGSGARFAPITLESLERRMSNESGCIP